MAWAAGSASTAACWVFAEYIVKRPEVADLEGQGDEPAVGHGGFQLRFKVHCLQADG
tara:strand:+ start:10609 stop:10779 length:171 start_codon:yes stop_codon:yes gene_type:complete